MIARSPLLSLTLLTALGLSGALLPAPADEVPFGDPIRGQALFAERGCVQCHAVRGAGGRIGPDLGRKAARASYYEIAATMWSHSLGMERKRGEYRLAHPVFEGQELSDLIAFLYFLNYFDEPGDPRAGRALFAQKHCIRCHSLGGEGGSAGPALDTISRGISPVLLAQALWNHGPQMVPAMSASGLEPPQFAGNEIVDLFAYVRSQGERQATRRFQSPGDPEKGREVFQAKGCGACHEIFGEGGGAGPDLGRVELRGSVTQIAGRMWNHWPEMSESMQKVGMSVPVFEGEELLDLFAYLYIARYAGEGGDARRGAAVYEAKECSVCHGAEGRGLVGPDLREATLGKPPGEILQDMWNHSSRMIAALEAQDLTWSKLSARELADLLAFLGAWPR